MREGPLEQYENLDKSISDFVSEYEDLLKSLGKLEPGQINIINDKILELDNLKEETQNNKVRAYITNCMERLASIVLSQMPEKTNTRAEGALTVNEEVRYDKAA